MYKLLSGQLTLSPRLASVEPDFEPLRRAVGVGELRLIETFLFAEASSLLLALSGNSPATLSRTRSTPWKLIPRANRV